MAQLCIFTFSLVSAIYSGKERAEVGISFRLLLGFLNFSCHSRSLIDLQPSLTHSLSLEHPAFHVLWNEFLGFQDLYEASFTRVS